MSFWDVVAAVPLVIFFGSLAILLGWAVWEFLKDSRPSAGDVGCGVIAALLVLVVLFALVGAVASFFNTFSS